MVEPVLHKPDMYRRLAAGAFGNTTPTWATVGEWRDRTILRSHPLWGLRHIRVANFPGTTLNVPTDKVEALIEANGFGTEYNISPMVPECIRWEGNVARMTDGYLCDGHARPVSGTWRRHMAHPDTWRGVAARVLLLTILNENSWDDLMVLFELYPDHVIELTALDECYGTVPGRNAIVWECRRY